MIMKFFRLFRGFLRDLYENRKVISRLTKRDYSNAYIGSFLGIFWSIIQPIVMIFVLWLVFKSFIGTLQPFYHAGFRGVMTTDSHLHDYRFHVSCLQIPVLMTTDSMLRATDSMRYPQAGANAG